MTVLCSLEHALHEPKGNDCPREAAVATDLAAPARTIDYADAVAVRELICEIHPFGGLLRYEGIVETCRRGYGRDLVELSTPPNIPEPEEIALAEVFDPSVEWIMNIEQLEHRAYVILVTGFFGADEAHKEAIRSVQDAGVVGLLAQANLRPPEKAKRRKAPSHRRRTGGQRLAKIGRRKLAGQKIASTGDLFAAFND